MFAQPDINPKQITKVSGVYLKNLDMPELVEKVLLNPCSCSRTHCIYTSAQQCWMLGLPSFLAPATSLRGNPSQARRAVIDHSAMLLREDNAMDLNYIVLDLPCTFFMLRSLRYSCCCDATALKHQSDTGVPVICSPAAAWR